MGKMLCMMVIGVLLFSAFSGVGLNKKSQAKIFGSINVEIIRPKAHLYIMDREIFPTGLTIVIGKITIEARVVSDYFVERVDFFIDGYLKKSDYVEPYTFLFEDTVSFIHTIKVEAFDLNGNKAEDIAGILMFNLRKNKMLNEDEASQILIEKVIKPNELYHDIIAFTTHRMLQSGDIISSGINNYAIDSPTWFFWVDDYPYFDFAHSTRYVFIDASDGEINVTHEDFPPWINGNFIYDDFFNKTNWVFSTYYGTPPSYNLSQKTKKTAYNEDNGNRQAIIYKGAPGKIRKDNCKAIENTLKNNGFTTQFIDMNFKQFEDTITNLKTSLKEGDELIIYLDSHGGQYEKANGKPKEATEDCKDGYIVMEYKKIDGKWMATKLMKDEEFKTLLDGFKKGVKIKVIIRSCYSGGFIDDLKKVENVKVILTSTDYNSKSYWPDLTTIEQLSKFIQFKELDKWLRKNNKINEWKKDDDKGTERKGLSEYTGGFVTGLSEKLGDYIKNKITQAELFEHIHTKILGLDEWYKNKNLIEEYWQYLENHGKKPRGWGANDWAEEPQKYIGDTKKPNVKIKEPKNGEIKSDKNCSLSGYATDDTGVVKIGYIHEATGYHHEYNESVEATRNYTFNWTIQLIEGWNHLTVYAEDEAGNTGNDSIIVYYVPDTQPPFVKITWPEDGYESNVANITVSGFARDNVGVAKIRFQQIAENYHYEYNLTLPNPAKNNSFHWDTQLIEGWNNLTVYAEDEAGNAGNDSIIVYYVPDHPPNKPSKPKGPTEAELGESLYYASNFTDPDGDSMEVMFDWGDGTNTSWIDPVENGSTFGEYHTYNSTGTYEIRVKARDIPYHQESEWSDPLTVNIY